MQADKILSTARTDKIGYYTTEQEADEQSIEWLEMIGFDPSAGIETYLALAGDGEDQLSGHSFGGKTCRKLYANNWLDDLGREVFVPIGHYERIHHSSCFRAYNVHREIIAHGYPSSSVEPRANGLSWQQLQSLASAAADIRVASVPSDNALVMKANKHWHDCPLAH